MHRQDETEAVPKDPSKPEYPMEAALDFPMAVASLLFLGLFTATVIVPEASPHQEWLEWAITAVWVLFVIEFAARFIAARERRVFLRRNWLDLLAVALPILRVLRLVRAFRAVHGATRLLALSRIWLVGRRGFGGLRRFLRVSRFVVVFILTVVVVVLAAAVVLCLEHGATDANILTFGDALWWSAALVTTVASEKNPVTGLGRVVAVTVMVYGMVVFGYFMSCAVVFIQGREEQASDRPSKGTAPTPNMTSSREHGG